MALAAAPAAFIGVFFLYPLAGVLARTFDAGTTLEVWRNPITTDVLWFTTWQALASTGLCLAAALPTAAVLARLRFRGRGLVHALLVVPFVLPTLVVAAAFLSLMDRLGLTDRFHHTVWAILAAHVFFNYAVIARSVAAFWSQLDPAPEQAAAVLGANRLRVFSAVTLPRLAPAVVAVSRGNTSVMTINCECDDPTRLPSGEGTISPVVDSADGRIFQALLEAFPVLSEVMQQTGKVCFICQSEGGSELFSPFRHVP